MLDQLDEHRLMIKNVATRHGLDANLVGALVITVSDGDAGAARFDPLLHKSGASVHDPEDVKPSTSTVETEMVHQVTSWGLMQIMGFVAREQGYRGWLTHLCRPKIGLEQGCTHLLKLFNRFGSVEEVVSNYNHGKQRRYVAKLYESEDFVDVVMSRYRQLAGERKF